MKCTPAQLLADHQDWLSEPGAVGVVQQREGGYIVCVKFDGVYTTHEDAAKSAETVRTKLRSALHKAINAQGQVDRAQARMDEL